MKFKNYLMKGTARENPLDRCLTRAVEYKSITDAKKVQKYLLDKGIETYLSRGYFDNANNLISWKVWTK